MMTQIEMDTMRAIAAFSKEYRRQNSFVKLNGTMKIVPDRGDVFMMSVKSLFVFQT